MKEKIRAKPEAPRRFPADHRQRRWISFAVKLFAEGTYNVASQSRTDYLFEFILPSNRDIRVSINGDAVRAGKAVLLEREAHEGDMHTFVHELWKVNFAGTLVAGANTIEIVYEQPVSIQEIYHGYFSSSKWQNSVGYEL